MVGKETIKSIKDRKVKMDIKIKSYNGSIDDLHEVYKAVCELVFGCGMMSFSSYDINFFLEKEIEIEKIEEIMSTLQVSNFTYDCNDIEEEGVINILCMNIETFKYQKKHIVFYRMLEIPQIELFKNYELANLYYECKSDDELFLKELEPKITDATKITIQ